MSVSKRLQAILDLIDKTDVIVDVGTDHGYLIIQAIKDGKCKKAYGLDIASGPLSYAQRNVIEHGFESYIELELMDGLEDFDQDANTFVIAGMGAETILSILDNYEFNTNQRLIIQSNTKHYWLRKELIERGFHFIDEMFLYDNKKAVTLFKIKKGQKSYSDKELYLGPILCKQDNKPYHQYLKKEYKKIQEVSKFNTDYIKLLDYLKEYLLEKGVINETNN
ncbi:MAG: SAM-dependent methyltransferase [Erysipelothrix sp.]|nr:SAM-dependent methyltransferase [Erysipelothrix sp.]